MPAASDVGSEPSSSPLSSLPDSIFSNEDENENDEPQLNNDAAVEDDFIVVEPERPRTRNGTVAAPTTVTPTPKKITIITSRHREVAAMDTPPGSPEYRPQGVSTRSTRQIAGQKRGLASAESASSTPRKVSTEMTPAAKRAKKAAEARKATDWKWEPDYVLTNDRSPLAKCDLRAILCHPRAWSCLSREDQQEIIALFPDSESIIPAPAGVAANGQNGASNGEGHAAAEDSLPRPDIAKLMSDDNFRHDCARYTEDLQAGLHNKAWLRAAWEAHEMRAAGNFDEAEVRHFEASWGVALPEEFLPASMREKGEQEDDDEEEDREGPGEPEFGAKTTAMAEPRFEVKPQVSTAPKIKIKVKAPVEAKASVEAQTEAEVGVNPEDDASSTTTAKASTRSKSKSKTPSYEKKPVRSKSTSDKTITTITATFVPEEDSNEGEQEEAVVAEDTAGAAIEVKLGSEYGSE